MGPVRQNPIQRTVSLSVCVCIALCTIVAHNIAQNRPDSFAPYPPDNHHCSDDVYLREGGYIIKHACRGCRTVQGRPMLSLESATQMANQLVQLFSHSSRQKVPILCSVRPYPSKLCLLVGDLDPIQHDAFFAGLGGGSLVWQTDRLTDHAIRSVTIGHIYVHGTAMQRNNA